MPLPLAEWHLSSAVMHTPQVQNALASVADIQADGDNKAHAPRLVEPPWKKMKVLRNTMLTEIDCCWNTYIYVYTPIYTYLYAFRDIYIYTGFRNIYIYI